jgi:plasmid stabilization system protein ParE
MLQFQLNEPARDDIAEILNLIAADNQTAANRVYKAIEKAFASLSKFPGMGALIDDSDAEFAGMRFWPLTKWRHYLAIYKQLPDGVEVVRVLHSARDATRVLRRRRR